MLAETAKKEAKNLNGNSNLSGPSIGAVLGSVLGVFGTIVLIGIELLPYCHDGTADIPMC